MGEVRFDPRPTAPVPDGLMQEFLISCRDTLRACWGVADVPDPRVMPGMRPHGSHPKMAALEAIQGIDNALKAAFCGDGGDAVRGHAMVSKSLSAKAVRMRQEGLGFEPPFPPPFPVILGDPPPEGQ